MPTTWRSRALLALGLLVAVAGAVLLARVLVRPGAPVAAPTPTASPTPTGAASQPFKVKLRSVRGEPIDDENLFGRQPDVRRDVETRAARAATQALARYLNAAFVADNTRFTAAPLRPLLTAEALRSLRGADRRALGQGGPRSASGDKSRARASAVVVYRGAQAYAVTLRYTAKMRMTSGSRRGPLTQSGVMVFVPGRTGWRADMVDVRLVAPEFPKKPAQPSNSAPSSQSEQTS